MMKVAVIGVGSISDCHLDSYVKNPETELYAICDINEKTLKAQGDRYNIPEERRFLDYKELLKLEEIEAVSVCTWNSEHAPVTIAALKAGKHVMCEKPMAINAEEAKKMLDAAKRTGKKLSIGYQSRFRDDSQYTKAEAEEGTFGDIYYAKATAIRRRAVPTWGVFLNEYEQGGGPLIDIGTHALDLTSGL